VKTMRRVLALACALTLACCSRAKKPEPLPAPPSPQPPAAEAPTEPGSAAVPPGELVRYVPSKARVFPRGDAGELLMSWLPVGASFESTRGQVLHGLLIAPEQLRDEVLSPLSAVAVLSATGWQKVEGAYRRTYTVEAVGGETPLAGTVDSSACFLVLAESGGVSAGFLERKVDIGGGDAQYNVLAVASRGTVTLVDTSTWVFPDTFHPSGVRGVTVSDLNADGSLEVAASIETIVSLNYLGATPLTWEVWLAERAGGWTPIFQYNESFATDEGSSYTAARRLLDSNGDGMLETVKVTTSMEELSEEREFRNAVVSFYAWDGTRYQKQAAEELPRQATVVPERATLFADVSIESGAVAELPRGALLYVFDRSDGMPRWYRAVSKAGAEGWIAAADVELTWLDPLKVNREVFLSQ
jgi:hypothetical protein